MDSRQPPSNIPAEQALLGAILVNNKAYEHCVGLIPEHFANDTHREIYRACQRRIERGHFVDAITLKAELEHSGLLNEVGGVPYLLKLITLVVSVIHAEAYARTIIDCAVRRGLISAATGISERAYGTEMGDGDGIATAAWAVEAIDEVAASAGTVTASTMAEAAAAAVAHSERAYRGDKDALGLMTGVAGIDAIWNGLHGGSLDILGARPSIGKSALALQIARAVGVPVAFFSFEMTARDIGLVNLASMSGVSADQIRLGRYTVAEFGEVIAAQRRLSRLPIHIVDQAGLPVTDAIAMTRALKRKNGIRMAVFDHRDLFGRADKQRDDIAWYRGITQSLKRAAKLLNIPILLLVQLSKDIERREDKRPRKSDLMYSGEQDADTIALLDRTEDRANLYFVKRRFGPTGVVPLKFTGVTTTFSDWPQHQTDRWEDQ